MTRYGDVIETSNSEIQTYMDCRRRWWLTYHRSLRLKREAPVGPLNLGSRVHRALEEGYSSPGREAEMRRVLAESIERDYPLAEELGVLDEFEKECELAVVMLEGFVDWASEEGLDAGWEVVHKEQIVRAPRMDFGGTPVVLKGKLDQVVRREHDGSLWMRDWKGQPLDGVVHSPLGPRRMGDLSVDDYVVGGDGCPTRITATQDLGTVPCYTVGFSDGGSLEVTEDHLWRLLGNGPRPGGLLSTKEMLNLGVDDAANRSQLTKRWQVPVVEPIRQPERDLPVDPYLLGLFLGDGHFRSGSGRASVCSADDEILEYAERYCKRPRKQDERSAVSTVILSDDVRHKLASLGLEGHLSYTKFIPPQYFGGSVSQRVALLHGLMDTDGSCQKTGRRPNAKSSFSTTSPYLRDGLVRLVRSLGGLAKRGSTLVGRVDGVDKADYWAVTVSMSRRPFRLQRKAEVWTPVKVERKVISIEPSGLKASRCIRVEADDGLYVAGWDYVVTHNTTADKHPVLMAFGPQLKTYITLLSLTEPAARVSGAQLIFLRKVKRTSRAEPPFYMQEPVYVSTRELDSFWRQTVATLRRMVETVEALEAGGSHHELAPPRPTRDCSWRCPYYAACPMFDDGSDVERLLEELYVSVDPYAYYNEDPDEEETTT